MLVTLHDTTFTASGPLTLTCTEGLSLSSETMSDDGRLTLTDADADKHDLRVILSAFTAFNDACDSSFCHEVVSAPNLLTDTVLQESLFNILPIKKPSKTSLMEQLDLIMMWCLTVRCCCLGPTLLSAGSAVINFLSMSQCESCVLFIQYSVSNA